MYTEAIVQQNQSPNMFHQVTDGFISYFKWIVYLSSLLSSLHIWDINPITDVEIGENLFLFCRLLLLTASFASQKLSSFMRFHSLVIDLSTYAIPVLFSTCPTMLCQFIQGFPPLSILLDCLRLF